MEKVKEFDSYQKEVMDLAVKYGFICQTMGGTAMFATDKNQLEAFGEEKYLQRQKGMNGIDMEVHNN